MAVLLLGADYYGTLAAARSLGRAGTVVYVADETRLGRTLFSRFVSNRYRHPPLHEVDAWLDWLITFGRKHAGTVLPATNDHLAWLFAKHRELLAGSYRLYQASEETILDLLDKKRLTDICTRLGIDTPRTELIESEADLGRIEAHFPFPLLIKPRTQIFLDSGVKGSIVETPDALRAELERYRALATFHPVFAQDHPEASIPMVQEYLPSAETRIFSISGFVDEKGELVCRSAMKVLQRPRKVGIGLCFEARPTDADLVDKLRRLAREVNYFGPFEAEFIDHTDGRKLLIDFNPRFFSQMAFDDARGLPTARLTYHAARGETDVVSRLIAEAHAADESHAGAEVYKHEAMLRLVLFLQGKSGQMSPGEVIEWQDWLKRHDGRSEDAIFVKDDPLPSVVDTASWVRHFVRHPRSFWRSFVQNR